MNIQTSIRADRNALLKAAREEAYATPLKDFHPGAPKLFSTDTLWPYFERLRKEEPVHYCTNAPIEPYWSVVKYNDIMHVDTSHGVFSSDAARGGINIRDAPAGYDWPSFIAMDQPRHAEQRKTVSPMFTPTHLDELAVLIRQRSASVLDNLPRNETFNFVERVSIERCRISLASSSRCVGVNIGDTVLRWEECRGWSIAMKLGQSYPTGTSRIEMPPSVTSEE